MQLTAIIKEIIFFILNLTYLKKNNSTSILMYHSIGYNKAFFTVKPEIFEKQIKYILDKGYKVIPLTEIITNFKNGIFLKKTVAITFDDGYSDNYQYAYPILRKNNLPATIFLPTSYIGKDMVNSENISLSILNIEQIKEMASNNIDFMPHTRNHIDLTRIDTSQLDEEINGSKNDIMNITKTDFNILAYPKGKYNDVVLNFLSNKKWDAALTVEDGTVEHSKTAFLLKRNSIDSQTLFSQFISKINGTINLYVKLKKII